MKDIRMIDIDADGNVSFDIDDFSKPLTDFEEAVQQIVIAIMNTPGTMTEYPEWGGGIRRLYLSNRSKDSESKMAAVIASALNSLQNTQADTDYKINNLELVSLVQAARGFTATIRVRFKNVISTEITIPGVPNVAF